MRVSPQMAEVDVIFVCGKQDSLSCLFLIATVG